MKYIHFPQHILDGAIAILDDEAGDGDISRGQAIQLLEESFDIELGEATALYQAVEEQLVKDSHLPMLEDLENE